MKNINRTQINQLVNGSTILQPSMVGTPHHIRMAVANQVHDENPQTITLSIRGIVLTLQESHSLSGKTWSWEANIDRETFIALGGDETCASPMPERNKYSIVMNQDATLALYLEVCKPGKKHTGYSTIIREEEVVIL